jgi:putative ABC transport system permease protein
LNFVRIVDHADLDNVNVGLVKLCRGADVAAAKQRLCALLPNDVDVFTRDEINAHEKHHWVVMTSTGFIFGSGAIVAVVVGIAIMYQSLATQVTRNLPEYATLKAIGYTDAQVSWVVLQQAILLSVAGFVPGLGAALLLYEAVRKSDYLPIDMPWTRVFFVFGISLFMAIASGLLALRKVRLADPADLY